MGNVCSCCQQQGSGDTEPIKRKIVMVGDGESGKSCLICRLATGIFVDHGYLPTVSDSAKIEVGYGDRPMELIVVDTAGRDNFDTLRPMFYRDVHVVVICFSIAEPQTLVHVREKWSPEVQYFCGNVPTILVGNKMDVRDTATSDATSRPPLGTPAPMLLPSNHTNESPAMSVKAREAKSSRSQINKSIAMVDFVTPVDGVAYITEREGIIMANHIGATAYFETSALTGKNVEELLMAISKAAVLGNKCKKSKPFMETLQS